RVGGAAQIKAIRKVSGSLRIDLSQHTELAAFAAFASDLDATSKAQLDRGDRLYQILRQGAYSPVPIEEQVISIFAGTRGFLDSVPTEDVRRFERELLDHVRRQHAGILQEIRDTKDLSDELIDRIGDVINKFKEQFTAADGSSVVDTPADAMDANEVGQESVTVHRSAPKK
ncbi:F0F1 ATP synthase subunit alpha, partial [Kibdelosporangium lantanae]